jgi:type III secretory pathway component EscV
VTFAVVHEREIASVSGAGGNYMSPAVYLAFLVFRDLLARGDRLIGMDETLYDLWILRDYQPVLVESALRTLGVGAITRVRRALAAAGLPVKDLRLLLERLLEHAVADPAFTEAGLVEAARGSLARELAARRALGDEPLVLFELDGDLIARLASGSDLDEDEQERVRDQLWSELRGRRVPAGRAILRVPPEVVWPAHALVSPEFPKTAVLASGEVADDAQAGATLSLT